MGQEMVSSRGFVPGNRPTMPLGYHQNKDGQLSPGSEDFLAPIETLLPYTLAFEQSKGIPPSN